MAKHLGKATVPMLKDVFTILKAASFKVDDTTMCIATLQYHTEQNEDNKTSRAKSRYRWLARVVDIEEAAQLVVELNSLEHRLERWKWPEDPSWDGFIATDHSTNGKFASWLRLRLKKCVAWDDGQKLLKGWKKKDDSYNLNAAYDTEGYQTESGELVSLTDREALKKQLGKNLWKELYRNVKAKEREAAIEDLRSKTGPGSEVVTKAEYDKMTPEQKRALCVKV